MFKTQVEPRAAGELFHCKVLNIYGVISMVYKSVDHGKLWSICFLQVKSMVDNVRRSKLSFYFGPFRFEQQVQ